MNILLAVDGSSASLHAVDHLIVHVREFRERPQIHLLYVHPPLPIGLATHPLSQETLQKYYREEGDSVLLAAGQRLLDAELPFSSHIHVGQPAEIIVKLAEELSCEFVCMGSRGHGAIGSALLGSVASKVLHLSTLPVLLVK